MISAFSLVYLSSGSKELPSVYSTVGIPGNLQRDQDLSEMFLLFQLHSVTVKFTAVDLGPLQLTMSTVMDVLVAQPHVF